MTGAPDRQPAGIVLVVVVVVLVALGLAGSALLSVSAQETRVGRARLDALRARVGAESAVRAALAAWHTDDYRDLARGERRDARLATGAAGPGEHYAAVVERLSRTTFLLLGEGKVVPRDRVVARSRAAALVRGIDPAGARSTFPAALTAAGTVEMDAGAVVEGGEATEPPPFWSGERCPPAEDGDGAPGVWVRDSAKAQVSAGADLGGEPPLVADSGEFTRPYTDALGPLAWEDLRAVADRTAAGSVRLQARRSDGACDRSAPGNWGDPLDPTGPCGDYFPLVFASGPLDLVDGAGQGILIVNGDLTIGSDVRFYGVALVDGAVKVAEDAQVYGAVRSIAGDAAATVRGGTVDLRECAVDLALRRSPGLNRPFRPSGRWWLPVF